MWKKMDVDIVQIIISRLIIFILNPLSLSVNCFRGHSLDSRGKAQDERYKVNNRQYYKGTSQWFPERSRSSRKM